MLRKILFVDDDVSLLDSFRRNYRNVFEVETALGAEDALKLIQSSGPYAVVLADMNMPGMSGIELLECVQKQAPEAVRMMLTGNADQATAVAAVNRGSVYRFLNKPCAPEVLVPTLEAGLQLYEVQHIERELLEGTLTGSIKLLTDVLGMVAPEALGRGQRLSESMVRFAKHLGAGPIWELEMSALFSSIGCASLPHSVLEKLRSGDDRTLAEEKLVRGIPQAGHNLLKEIPRFGGVAKIVLFQDKAFDGSGVPAVRCAGPEIPLGARMLKILGDRMALESHGIVRRRAFDVMKARTGLYDPELLTACFSWSTGALNRSVSQVATARLLNIRDLCPGQVVAANIVTLNGKVLSEAGDRLTPMILRRLQNYDALGEVSQPVSIQDDLPG